MKKITAILGASHSEFDHQLKNTINGIVDAIDVLILDQQAILEYQNKILSKQHADTMQSQLCDSCKHKAYFTTIDLDKGIYKSYCNKCLSH